MSDPSFGSAPDAMTLTTLEPPPFAPSADTQSSPAAGHFLPRNPLPYLAPSATHQPELLLLSWMIATLDTIVTDLQNHPLVSDPIPPTSLPSLPPDPQHPSPLGDHQHRLMPRHTPAPVPTCSPGSPGHYRMDPAARFPPSATTNFLSTLPLPPPSCPPTTRVFRKNVPQECHTRVSHKSVF